DRAVGDDLERVGITTRRRDRVPQLWDRLREPCAADRDPAVGVLGDVGEQGGARGPADEHGWAWELHRLRPRPAGGEAHELAREARLVVGPQTFHGEHVLASDGAATAVLDAVVLHLLLVPAEADAEAEAPTGHDVESGDGLG